MHGLARLEEKGLLKRLDAELARLPEPRIAISRGFRGKAYDGIGCGVCTSEASTVMGCPPDGIAVTEFLESLALGGKN